MAELKTAVVGVCLLSIAVSVCLLICPDSSLRKQVKFLVSLVCIISLISPFRHLQIPSSLDSLQLEHASSSVQALTEAAAEKALNVTLQKSGLSCERLEVSVHVSEDNCISITDVSLICDDPQSAVVLLKDLLGEEVHLHVSQALESVQK